MPPKSTLFKEFAGLCNELAATSKRTRKIELLKEFLLKLSSEELEPAILYLAGRRFSDLDERILDISARTLWKMRLEKRQAALIEQPLTISTVSKYFDALSAISGPGSRKKKERLLEALLSQATPIEMDCLARILVGEMRIGVVEGIMLDAIAAAAGLDADLVRRSYMLLGDLARVGSIALRKGPAALRSVGIELFSPIRPMMAEMSYDISEILRYHGGSTAFEFKYDGARIQIHKKGDRIQIFSRRLTNITESIPDIVSVIRDSIRAESALLEGEVLAVGHHQKPLPFQDLMRRLRRVHAIEAMVREIPLELRLFDILYHDGRTLIDTPYEERWSFLAELCPKRLLADRIVTDKPSQAEGFMTKALEAGHEGLMAKSLKSYYTPGIRGKKWFKYKPADRLDVAIIAAEWGSGRRRGWLSNYHLAVLNEPAGSFAMIGKTFKGLTDEEFTEMTKRLLECKMEEDEFTVHVEPRVVVEVAYNEIQRSQHYESGYALRFARIVRIRDDKSPEEIDTLENLNRLYRRQFVHKAQPPP